MANKYSIRDYTLIEMYKPSWQKHLDQFNFHAGYTPPNMRANGKYELFVNCVINNKPHHFKGEFTDFETMDEVYGNKVKQLLRKTNYAD